MNKLTELQRQLDAVRVSLGGRHLSDQQRGMLRDMRNAITIAKVKRERRHDAVVRLRPICAK
jgi:hypothetical protein